MRWVFSIFTVLFLAGATPSLRAVDPLPESQQAPLARKILDAYHGKRSASPLKLLHVVYFTPADRDPVPKYQQRLEAILEDLRSFYRDEMERQGFGPTTFDFERDAKGRLIVHLVKGSEPKSVYVASWSDRRKLIGDKCEAALAVAGLSLNLETVVIVCNLVDWDETARTYRNPSPYTGSWTQQGGLCWLMDSPILDLDNLPKKGAIINDWQFGKVPLGKRNSMFIGTFGHELGHAFGLPHSGNRWDEKITGNSIMGNGSLEYRDERRGAAKGAILTFAGAMRLAARPLFNNSDKGRNEKPGLDQFSTLLSTNLTSPGLLGRHGTLRLEGTAIGSPPIYGVIAYFNSVHDAGYRSPAAAAVPDSHGNFAIEVSDLIPCEKGELTVTLCHVNGGVSERQLVFTIPKP